MPGVEHRSVSPFISWLRNKFRGKPVIECLRHADGVAARTQPPPTVPGGPYHKTSKIYYYTRDVRRLVQPPTVVYSATDTPTRKIDAFKAEPLLRVAPKSVDKKI